ncbi:MAG TPA: alginate lyase family protein [Opitutaceae bacterium]|jgi:hypothetical protein|nr:alginate lyase family protein [Opitutaceae bacterium]
MKYLHAVLGGGLCLLGLLLASCANHSSGPQVYCLPVANLGLAKQRVAQNDPSVREPFAKLIENAHQALLSVPGSVMDKSKVAASGDMHDYFSFGPYWWPDPNKPDGLPYIKYDGYTYPKCKIGTDAIAFTRLLNDTEALAYAYYFTGRADYADKASELIRVWFLNPATAMNPNANYAQAVPGVANGRFEGEIELRGLTRIADAVALIDASPAWTKNDRRAFRCWLESYYAWLTHAKLPSEATSEENNHESWHDVQVVHFAIVLGKTDYARTFLQQEFPRLLAMQVAGTGEQRHELVRKDSLGYSLFNLEALFRLATLGEYMGVDCWKFTTKDHGNLNSALDYLAPYTDPENRWPIDEVSPTNRDRLLPLLVQANAHQKSQTYQDLLDIFYDTGPDFWRLQWPYEKPAKTER